MSSSDVKNVIFGFLIKPTLSSSTKCISHRLWLIDNDSSSVLNCVFPFCNAFVSSSENNAACLIIFNLWSSGNFDISYLEDCETS